MNKTDSYKKTGQYLPAAILAAALLVACSDGNGPNAASGGANGSVNGGSSDPTTGNPGGNSNPAGPTRLADLKAGDCTTPSSDGLFVSDMTVIECSQPHKMQVAGRFDYAEASDANPYSNASPALHSSSHPTISIRSRRRPRPGPMATGTQSV